MFECLNDPGSARALVAAAAAWYGERGMDTLRGAMNLSMNDECAFLADGFNAPPAVMMPYNPPYYLDLMAACGLAKDKDTSFWVRSIPIFYSPVFALPANSRRQSGFLLPYAGGSTLNGFMAEIPYYWAIRPDMDATFYAQYLSKRGFMGGAEFRMVNETWGEAIWLLNYIHDQVDEQTLLENGYSFEGRERYWLRSRHSFLMPYGIEGRLNMDLVFHLLQKPPGSVWIRLALRLSLSCKNPFRDQNQKGNRDEC